MNSDTMEWIANLDEELMSGYLESIGVQYSKERRMREIAAVEQWGGHFLVEYRAGRPVGYAQVIVLSDDACDTFGFPRRTGEIGSIQIDSLYQGTSVFRNLYTRIQEYFRQSQCPMIRATAQPSNDRSMNVMLKAGFHLHRAGKKLMDFRCYLDAN